MRGLVGPSSGPGAAARRAGSLLRPARGGRVPGIDGIRGIRGIVTPARAAALLGMLASGFLFSLATGPTAFGVSRIDLPDLTWTSATTITTTLALADGVNAFQVDTAPLEAALEALPAVAAADVSIELPDAAVVVRIDERVPVLAWQVGGDRFLADREGAIFALVDEGAALPPGVAVVDDERAGAADRFAVGSHLDTVDLDVATRLGSLAPADAGSSAPRLRVAVNDTDGFVVSTQGGWVAVFGFYSPATRPADMIPGQVRLLRSFLGGRESQVRRIVLASATDGTYVPLTTPRPTKR
jgi:hypothetical protein